MEFGKRFLHDPDEFPNLQRSPGNDSNHCVNINGPLLFAGLSPAQVSTLEKRFGSCDQSTDSESPEAHIQVSTIPLDTFIAFDRSGWEYAIDTRYHEDRIELCGYRYCGIIRLEPEISGELWTDCEEGAEFRSVAENFSRILVAYRILLNGGVMLHSSGVKVDDEALLFYGHSNAGKSTMARLAVESGYQIFSDDINLVLPGDPPGVQRMPFSGDYGNSMPVNEPAYPLRGLYNLKKGENTISVLSAGHGLAALIANSPFVNQDPFRIDQLTANLQRIITAHPVCQIAFSRDNGFNAVLATINATNHG
ncbi:MAG: hypothetical protein ACWA5Q_04790 [bacterium]